MMLSERPAHASSKLPAWAFRGGRDEHLPYRFVDATHARHCTRNPLRRGQVEDRDYFLLNPEE